MGGSEKEGSRNRSRASQRIREVKQMRGSSATRRGRSSGAVPYLRRTGGAEGQSNTKFSMKVVLDYCEAGAASKYVRHHKIHLPHAQSCGVSTLRIPTFYLFRIVPALPSVSLHFSTLYGTFRDHACIRGIQL